jgi:hypothetical protein
MNETAACTCGKFLMLSARLRSMLTHTDRRAFRNSFGHGMDGMTIWMSFQRMQRVQTEFSVSNY